MTNHIVIVASKFTPMISKIKIQQMLYDSTPCALKAV